MENNPLNILRSQSVINDVVIRPDLCNMRCSYCGLTTEKCPTLLYKKNSVGRYYKSENKKIFERVETISSRTKKYVSTVRTKFPSPILKLSGGEITAIPGLVDIVFYYSRSIPVIQILTNGTGLNEEIINRFSKYSNIHIQLSLDGHTVESNRYRGLSEYQLDKIKSLIAKICINKIPLEINTVITNVNINTFKSFTYWIYDLSNKYDNDVNIWPRPVKGTMRNKFSPSKREYRNFFNEISFLEDDILPPIQYFKSYKNIINNQSRICYIPFFVCGLEDSGIIPRCTCNSNLGMLCDVSKDDSFGKIKRWSVQPETHYSCNQCFNQYELFNLFVKNIISLDYLLSLPLFNNPKVREVLTNIKSAIKERFGGINNE